MASSGGACVFVLLCANRSSVSSDGPKCFWDVDPDFLGLAKKTFSQKSVTKKILFINDPAKLNRAYYVNVSFPCSVIRWCVSLLFLTGDIWLLYISAVLFVLEWNVLL